MTRTRNVNKKVNVTNSVDTDLLSFLSASVIDIKLHKVILTAMYQWVCNIYGCDMHTKLCDTSTKRERDNRGLSEWRLYISLELN